MVGTVVWNLTREREPVYEGKPLRVWLFRYPPGGGYNDDFIQGRIMAIRSIGTNAVPWLLNWVRFEPQDWRTNLATGVARRSAFISWPLIRSWIDQSDAKVRSQRAAYTLGALGSDAQMALPELQSIATNAQDEFAAETAFNALGYCGVDAMPSILGLAANTNYAAVIAVSRSPHFLNNFRYRLNVYLTNSDPLVRQGASNLAGQVTVRFPPKPPGR